MVNRANYLVTTQEWFYAPDGKKYKSAWGCVDIVDSETTLGIKANRYSTNWYAVIGDNNIGIIIAGCQISYAVRCKEKPNTDQVGETAYDNSSSKFIKRDSEIYIAQEK